MTPEQRKEVERVADRYADAATRAHRVAGEALRAFLAEFDAQAAELAELRQLLANVVRDEATGAAECAAARAREVCLGLVERWEDFVPDGGHITDEIARRIRARGPLLPPPAEEGELERLRELEMAVQKVTVAPGAFYHLGPAPSVHITNTSDQPITVGLLLPVVTPAP